MKKNGKNGNGAANERKDKRRGGGPLLNIGEVAVALGEKERSIRTWAKAGVIPKIVIGSRTHRFELAAILAALKKRSV